VNWLETLRTGLEATVTHRLRSGLTVLGILIGIAAVILTVGLGEGAQNQVASEISSLGSNLLTITPGSSTSSTGVRGGLGTATTLSEETKDSKRKMKRALWFGWAVAGVALIVPSYALTVGWGVSAMTGYAKSADPGLIVYRHYLTDVGWGILIAVTMSSYLSYMVSKVNAVTRIWYSAGRDGIFYGRIKGINQRFKTPSQAVVAFGVVILVVDMVAGIILGPVNGALWLLTISGICIIGVHMVSNTALTVYTVRLGKFRPILHGLIPSVATIIGGIVIYYSAVPLPSGSFKYAVLLSLAWLVAGFGALAWYLRRHPDILRTGGMSRGAPESEAPPA